MGVGFVSVVFGGYAELWFSFWGSLSGGGAAILAEGVGCSSLYCKMENLLLVEGSLLTWGGCRRPPYRLLPAGCENSSWFLPLSGFSSLLMALRGNSLKR